MFVVLQLLLGSCEAAVGQFPPPPGLPPPVLVHSEVIIALPPSGAEPLEVLAAQELRRAIYSSSGKLCDIVRAGAEGADQSAGEAGRGRSVLAIGRAAAGAVLATEPEEAGAAHRPRGGRARRQHAAAAERCAAARHRARGAQPAGDALRRLHLRRGGTWRAVPAERRRVPAARGWSAGAAELRAAGHRQEPVLPRARHPALPRLHNGARLVERRRLQGRDDTAHQAEGQLHRPAQLPGQHRWSGSATRST